MLPLGIGGINLAGLGPVRADLSRERGLAAAVGRCRGPPSGSAIEAEHVMFGHTHRAGPLANDDSLEWVFAGGGRLINSGCWVYEPAVPQPWALEPVLARRGGGRARR